MSAKYKPSDYEVLRRRCVELKEADWKQKGIALALGLTEGWVSQTLKKYREQGPEGLVARKPTGYPPKMKTEQLSQLVGELEQGADGATIRRCQEVKDFLTRKKGRVYLVALPGYSPELNPVELLWSQPRRPDEKGVEEHSIPQFGGPDQSAGRKNRRDKKRHGITRLILL